MSLLMGAVQGAGCLVALLKLCSLSLQVMSLIRGQASTFICTLNVFAVFFSIVIFKVVEVCSL